jgi:hypothetical protein
MNENPKMASNGDYWDEQTLERIIELLRETLTYFQRPLQR